MIERIIYDPDTGIYTVYWKWWAFWKASYSNEYIKMHGCIRLLTGHSVYMKESNLSNAGLSIGSKLNIFDTWRKRTKMNEWPQRKGESK